MNNPLVSIIIPTYNRAHLISETLDSVLAQTYTNWECIVVDDGSTDNTIEVINSYVNKDARFQLHHRPADRLAGGNSARNYGTLKSKSKIIVFLDSDDQLMVYAIENRVKRIIENVDGSFDLLINNTLLFYNKIGDTNLLWNIMKEEKNICLLKRFYNNDTPWQTNGVTWNKDFFDSIGGWNENLKAWQDWEIHIRALFHNPNVLYFEKYPDNYYKISFHNSIKDFHKTYQYYNSVKHSFLSILKLQNNTKDINDLTKIEFKRLALRILILKPLENKFFLEPFFNLVYINKIKEVNFCQYFKVYLIGVLGSSFKMKKYLVKKIYLKQYKDIYPESKYKKYSITQL